MAGTILVVEDDAIILASNTLLLSRSGYRVLAAESAQRAMAVVSEHVGGLDLLVTDLVLDGASGIDLARSLRQTHPGLQVIVLTGADREQLDQETAGLGHVEVLRKPVSWEQLKGCVQKILEAA